MRYSFFQSFLRVQPAAQRRLWLALVPLLLFVAARTIPTLSDNVFYTDEFYSVTHLGVQPPLNDLSAVIQSVIQNSPQHVPFYFILLSLWAHLVGWDPLALRLLAVLFMLLLVAWTYRVGRDTAAPYAGFLAAALVTTCLFLIHFAHAVRQYTLLPLLALIVGWFYWRIIIRDGTVRWYDWLLFYLAGLALIYTHVMGLFPLLALGLYHLGWLFNRWRTGGVRFDGLGRWWAVAALLLLVGVSFLPWMGVILAGMDEINSGVRETIISGEFTRYTVLMVTNDSLLLLLLGLGLALWALLRRERGAGWAWFWALAPLLVMLIADLFTSSLRIGRIRYAAVVMPFIALLLGLGLAQLTRWRGAVPALLAVFVFTNFAVNESPLYQRAISDGPHEDNPPPIHRMVDVLQRYIQPDDYLVGTIWDEHILSISVREDRMVDYYLGMLGIDYIITNAYIESREAGEAIWREVRAALDTHEDVWLLVEPVKLPHMLPLYLDALAGERVLCEVVMDEPRARIERYGKPGTCAPLEPAPHRAIRYLDGLIVLNDTEIDPPHDGAARVSTSWTISEALPPDTYSVTLQLFNSAGEKVWQADYGLEVDYFAVRRSDLPLDNLPPGDYTLSIAVYNWRTQERTPGVVVATGEQGDFLLAESFTLP